MLININYKNTQSFNEYLLTFDVQLSQNCELPRYIYLLNNSNNMVLQTNEFQVILIILNIHYFLEFFRLQYSLMLITNYKLQISSLAVLETQTVMGFSSTSLAKLL